MRDTAWRYDTSSEDSVSLAMFAVGAGSLYFVNGSDGQRVMIPYRFGSLGASKGFIANVADSTVDDASGGFINVQSLDDEGFSLSRFPCRGWMIMGGATAGVFVPSFVEASGLDAGFVLFGFKPFAATAVWGRFRSFVPGIGASWNLCFFGDPAAA